MVYPEKRFYSGQILKIVNEKKLNKDLIKKENIIQIKNNSDIYIVKKKKK
jgi:hypothetical protein